MKVSFFRLVCVLVVMTLGCGAAGAEVANRVVAFVNDDVVTLYELNNRIRALTESNPEDLERIDRERFEDIRKRVLDLLIEEKITLSQVREMGLEAEEKEIDAAVDRIKRNNDWSLEDFMRNLEREGVTLDTFRRDLAYSIQRNRLINYEVKSKIVISEEAIKQYYEFNKSSFSSPAQVSLAGILLALGKPDDPREREALLRKAENIMDRLSRGESFSDLARKFSMGPGADEGGVLGDFLMDQLDSQILEAIENLEPGEVSKPILRPQGVQILKILDRGDDLVKPLEEVRGAIYDTLYEREMESRYQKWIGDLKRRSYIKKVL